LIIDFPYQCYQIKTDRQLLEKRKRENRKWNKKKIYNKKSTLFVASINKWLQGWFTSEMLINLSHVLSSISVELIWIVIRNRWDPNSIETHVLDVCKIVLDSLEVTTTVVWLGIQVASRSWSITQSESFRKGNNKKRNNLAKRRKELKTKN